MRRLLIIFLTACMLQSCSFTTKDANLVWSDEFDGSTKEISEKWNVIMGNGCPDICGWGNNEKQFYTDSTNNLRIEEGVLIIETHKVDDDRNYTSSKLTSEGKGDWHTGYLEISAKLPGGRGTWPAIWMLPTLQREMKWPADGEIDIMEHVGYNQGMVYGTIHTKAYNHMRGTQKSDSVFINDASKVFHTYAINWTEQKIEWFVDDIMYHVITKGEDNEDGWPFTKPYHLILNLAGGGNWGGRHGVDETIWPQRLEVDYVRVYGQKPKVIAIKKNETQN